jgi:nitrate reductase NapA
MMIHFGHNARESHPIIFWRIADYKKKKDIPTVVVDPRRTGTVMGYEDVNPNNSVHVPILNGDISFLNSIAHVLLKDHEDVIDWPFLKKHVKGWKNYIDGVTKRYSPEQVQQFMGGENHDVSPELIRRVASMFADATRKRLVRAKDGKDSGGVIIMWGIGYNQHIHGQHNIISIINLLTLTGNLAKPGCGPFSMTGQPNAMGERFTGGLTGRLPFNKSLKDDEHRKHMAIHWKVPIERLDAALASPNSGMAIGMMERAMKGEIKAMFWVYATHIDMPDQENCIRPGLKKTFNVVQEIYRHAPNNLYADVIFPAATWGEVDGCYISSERRINICEQGAMPPKGCLPDLDLVVHKGHRIAELLGLDADKIFPWPHSKKNGFIDAEEIFRDICRASEGTDTDLTGILEVEKVDGISPYEQLKKLRGIQWPAPTYGLAKSGGAKRRYMAQEGVWKSRPYGYFRTKDGKVHMKLCEQDYSNREELTKKLMEFGVKKDHYVVDHKALIVEARDKGLTPDLPDESHRGKKWDEVPKDKFPYWFGLGVVYEHFHTAKSNRSPTTARLVPEMYVEMHEDDAKDLGIKDGEKVRVVTRRGSLEARAQVGTDSLVKPARNNVPRGYMFGPWNLSVADSAIPEKNKWLANRVTSRVYDPVSGQVDFKKSAARIEKI